jgi:hypothetical protein
MKEARKLKSMRKGMVMALATVGGCVTLGGWTSATPQISVRILMEGGYAWAFSEHESRVDVGSVLLPTPHPVEEHEHPLRLAVCEGRAESTIAGTAPAADRDGWYSLADWRMSLESGMTPQLQQQGWQDVLDVSAEYSRVAAPVDQVFTGYITLNSGTATVTAPRYSSVITRPGNAFETRKLASEVVWADSYNDDYFYLHFDGLHGNEGKWGVFRIQPDPKTRRVTVLVSPGRVLSHRTRANQSLPHFNMFYRVLEGPQVPEQRRLVPHCPEDCDNEPKDCSNFLKTPDHACPIARFSR